MGMGITFGNSCEAKVSSKLIAPTIPSNKRMKNFRIHVAPLFYTFTLHFTLQYVKYYLQYVNNYCNIKLC